MTLWSLYILEPWVLPVSSDLLPLRVDWGTHLVLNSIHQTWVSKFEANLFFLHSLPHSSHCLSLSQRETSKAPKCNSSHSGTSTCALPLKGEHRASWAGPTCLLLFQTPGAISFLLPAGSPPQGITTGASVTHEVLELKGTYRWLPSVEGEEERKGSRKVGLSHTALQCLQQALTLGLSSNLCSHFVRKGSLWLYSSSGFTDEESKGLRTYVTFPKSHN